MNKSFVLLLSILLVAIAFDRLFWHQGFGVDLPVFALLVLGVLLYDRGWSQWSAAARWNATGVLISSAMVIVHGSVIAIVAAIITLATCSAFVLSPRARTTALALFSWGLNLALTPMGLLLAAIDTVPGTASIRSGWRRGRLAVMPVAVMCLFFVLYRGGNSRFHALTAGFLDSIGRLIDRFFADLFTAHVLFLILALLVAGSLLKRSVGGWLADREALLHTDMVRRRRPRPNWLPALSMGALDRERRMAVLLLVLVNLLLLVVNAIDIHWIWFGFTVEPGMSLKEFVHEGTWLLIISILLSMGILLHLFRANLNFHPERRTLLWLAYAWLAQNFVLGISVFLRNYHYIAFHGLAYKRIGVIVFLLLVLVGLVSLHAKLRYRRTLFQLFRVNAWAVFAVLVGLSTVDWDSTIVRYNLDHWNQGQIDVDNYLAMSDKVLPMLFDHMDLVRQQMSKHEENEVRWVKHLDPEEFRRTLEERRAKFMERYRHQDWQSWTWADERTFHALQALHVNGDPS